MLLRGQIFQRGAVPAPLALSPAGPEAPPKRRKKAPEVKHIDAPTPAVAAGGGAGVSSTSGAGGSRRKRRAGALSAAGATNGGSVVPAASASVSDGHGTPTGGRSPRGGAGSGGAAHGRWTAERYDSARRSLVHVLRALHATAPEVAVLRPALRDDARKVIGDTGKYWTA
jgi:hypothetical protein